MKTLHLTCIFKLHNPSAHKRVVMEYALREYTLAYQRLLDAAKTCEDTLESNGRYQSKRTGEESYTGMSIGALLPAFDLALHTSVKDSLLKDVAGNLASYFALKAGGFNPSFPVCRDPDPDAILDALDDFARVGSDLADENASKARLLKQARGRYMPLLFCRADGASQTKRGGARNRNFSLLWNTEKRQLLAALWLLPAGHALCQPLGADRANLIRLDTGEVFNSNTRAAILVPLEIGRNGWQERKFLEACFEGRARAKSGELVKDERTGSYYLHVAFEFECPEPYTPAAYLGADKGILITIAHALVGGDGALVEMGHFDDNLRLFQIENGKLRRAKARRGKRVLKRDYKQREVEGILNRLANLLIEKALAHQAEIVVEKLDNIQVSGRSIRSRFSKLDTILKQKCQFAGVPFRRVFAAYSSIICPQCGEDMQRDDRHVWCEHCGYDGHSDDSGAVNIARRALYRKEDWKERGGYRGFHRAFANGGTFPTK